jgi:hypothetical protein
MRCPNFNRDGAHVLRDKRGTFCDACGKPVRENGAHDGDGPTFQLTIELGNDAMRTGSDIAGALGQVATRLTHDEFTGADLGPDAEASGRIRDENGNTVGTWSVTA